MATFVLVHGGGHGGWCYGRIKPLLEAAGHDVYAPSLTGLGDRKHLLAANVGLDTHITDIANLIAYQDLTDVYLLGHSYGGMVISGVAGRVPDRIRHLIFLDAAHPKNGESLADVAPAMMAMAQSMLRVVDGVEVVLSPEDETPIQYYGVADPTDLAWLRSKLTAHPWKCFSQKLVIDDEPAMRRIPFTNINCSAGLRMSTDEARARMLEGSAANYEIDTGHDLMVTEPDWTADTLIEIARG